MFVDTRREVVLDLVQLIDDRGEPRQQLQINGRKGASDVAVVFAAERLEMAEITPACETMLWNRVNPEAILLVPGALFARGERKLHATTGTCEVGVNVPISRTDAAVLSGGIASD